MLIRARPFAVRLGLLAVLFQAVLFGWHHHNLTFPRDGHRPVTVANAPTQTGPVADDGDGCDICQILHHQTAAAATVGAEPATPLTPLAIRRFDAGLRAVAPSLAFQARAPPPA